MGMQKKKLAKVKYTAYIGASIDGRISKDSLSSVDWTSKEDWNFFQKSLSKIDAVIVGHNTFKVSENRLKWRNTIVLTSKISHLKVEGTVTFFNPKKSNLKRFLQNKGYKKVAILGGGKVYDFCLRNKMTDKLFVTIEPYVFTTGVPMFSGNKFKKYGFILESVKRLNKKGTVLLKYKYGN
ncbi:MAG: Dihydrofolate reductase [Parcubacteria group bacterium GW2011_GWB1_36_5]|nr:MAG: Dihydrofolate reductase [Parcubacteria group bacterium GW2011_GWA2_36_24]KKQ07594.1 MAG: Dihydrofolate reductase [Parcubacteria group bacterium GW2011_GWB1_36_5]